MNMRYIYILCLAACGLTLSSISKPQVVLRSTKVHKDSMRYFTYIGGLIECVPRGKVEFKGNTIVFYKGTIDSFVSLGEKNRLFPDSMFPITKLYTNDSWVKTRLALPIAPKRYFPAQVETLISGEFTGELVYDVNNDIILSYAKGSGRRCAVVRIKGTNIIYLLRK